MSGCNGTDTVATDPVPSLTTNDFPGSRFAGTRSTDKWRNIARTRSVRRSSALASIGRWSIRPSDPRKSRQDLVEADRGKQSLARMAAESQPRPATLTLHLRHASRSAGAGRGGGLEPATTPADW